MVHHFVDLVGFGPFCNGACFCLFPAKRKKKRKGFKMCGCGKGQDYFEEGYQGWWVRRRRKARSLIYSSMQES